MSDTVQQGGDGKRRFAVAGGTRASGLAFVVAARAAGHAVTALARTAEGVRAVSEAGAEAVLGDALVPADLARFCAAAGPATAVSFLGSRRGEARVDAAGNIAFIDAAVAAGMPAFVLVTSLGCGDTWELLSPRMREVIGEAVREKTTAEEHLRAAPIAWTIVRPGGLLDGAADGTARLDPQPSAIGRIARGELARLVLGVATDAQWRGRSVAAHGEPIAPPAPPAG